MKITVVCCGPLERLTGTAECHLQLPEDSTLANVAAALAQQFPASQALLPQCAMAIGSSLAGAGTPLADGDVVAVLPPVAGG